MNSVARFTIYTVAEFRLNRFQLSERQYKFVSDHRPPVSVRLQTVSFYLSNSFRFD